MIDIFSYRYTHLFCYTLSISESRVQYELAWGWGYPAAGPYYNMYVNSTGKIIGDEIQITQPIQGNTSLK